MLLLVAFSAVIPLMTVVNYSVQDTFGNNEFFWEGVGWFEEMIRSDRLHEALWRQLTFSAIILAIEVPLGIFVALNMPKKGFWASFCLVLMSLPLLVPFNVVGTIWQIFCRVDIGLLGHTLAALGIDYNYTNDTLDAWATVIVMDVWHWTSLVALLSYAGLQSIPDAYYQAAKIDQAGRLSVFRYIELPKMQGVLLIDRGGAPMRHASLPDRIPMQGTRAVEGFVSRGRGSCSSAAGSLFKFPSSTMTQSKKGAPVAPGLPLIAS